MKEELPPDVYIISYNPPSIISSIHKTAITPSVFMKYFEVLPHENVILFKDFWWYSKDSSQIESELRDKYEFKLIKSKSVGRRNYSFYNLTLKQ